MKLSDNKQKLLEATVVGLIPDLEDNIDLKHVRQSAFDYYSSETGETFQVHITVTRDVSDFLEFLQTEEMS